MNNASCYQNYDKYVFDSSEDEEQWELKNTNFVKIDKSVSMQNSLKNFSKPINPQTPKHSKKTQSFLLDPKQMKSHGTNGMKQKNKPKKKNLNTSLNINQQNSTIKNNKKNLNKTTINPNRSSKSSKTSKAKSNLSKDYLIINETIYECNNMQEVTQKLMYKDPQFFTYGRYCKSVLKHMSKIQQYFLGFKDRVNYEKRTQLRLSKLTEKQKQQLYTLLKQAQPKQTLLEDIMKEAIENVEAKTSQLIKENDQYEVEAVKWRNSKLHQIMVANSCLSQNFTDLTDSTVSKDLQIFFNESSIEREVERQRKQKNKFKEQQYFVMKQSQVEKRILEQRQEHSSNIGKMLHFLNDFFSYLYENDKIQGIVEKLHIRYGFSQSEKQYLFTIPYKSWNQLCFDKEQAAGEILSTQHFIEYSKLIDEIIQNSKDTHLLHKAFFDCVNELLIKFQPDYPFGSPHPFDISQNLAFYIIDNENFGCVWEEIMKEIQDIMNTLLGLQIDDLENNKELEEHKQKAFKQNLRKQIKKNEEDKLFSIAFGQTIYSICETIEKELLHQFFTEDIFL